MARRPGLSCLVHQPNVLTTRKTLSAGNFSRTGYNVFNRANTSKKHPSAPFLKGVDYCHTRSTKRTVLRIGLYAQPISCEIFIMKWRFLQLQVLLFSCGVASFLPAQPSREGLAAKAAGVVSGTVVFGDTGAPAEGVFVNLLPPSPAGPAINPQTGEYLVQDVPRREDFHARVDAEGHFTIADVPPGNYTVLTYAPGYLSPEPGIGGVVVGGAPLPAGDIREVHVSAGATRAVSLRLEHGGAIEGTVYSGDGRITPGGEIPVGGIAVNAERKLDDGRLVRTGGAAHTDSAGHYRLDGLAPGSYVVFTTRSAPMVQTGHGLISSGGESFFAPGTVRSSHARTVLLQGAETVSGMNLMLPVNGVHTVSGTVLSNGSPANVNGLVRIYPTGEPGLSRATPIGVGGQFTFTGVPDEQYTVSTEFSPNSEVVGVSADRRSLRMRMREAPYTNATLDVNVGGSDVTGITLQVSPLAQ